MHITKLKPFQFEGVLKIKEFGGRALNCDEMGLGKTIQTLYWIYKHPQRRPVVIVTPASLKWNWESEAKNHFGLRCVIIEGRASPKSRLPASQIYIVNYDILASWVKLLKKVKPKIIVFDEGHFLKSSTAKRSRASYKLSKDVESVLVLSGTPFTNRPIELWQVLKIVCPKLFPSKEKFAWRYCNPRFTRYGWQYDGSTNSKELNRKLRENCMIRRLKKDVLKELPDKMHRTIGFRLSPKNEKEYRHAKEDFIGWLSKVSPAKANKAKKSLALSKLGYLLRLTAKLKLEWSLRWIADFFEGNPGKKLIAFSMHTAVIEAVKERFPHALVINGGTKTQLRQEIVRKFQSNPKRNLFVGNWKAAGVGLNLTAAHNVAALDLPWTPADTAQGSDRAHRIGQKETVTIWYLIALGTVEEKQAKLLRKKQKILDAVLDGTRNASNLDIFKELIQSI